MSRVLPQSFFNEFACICCHFLEVGLLPISNYLHSEASGPQKQTEDLQKVPISLCFSSIHDHQSQEGTHCEVDPESLKQPGVEEPQPRLLNLHEATVMSRFEYPQEQEAAESAGPYYDKSDCDYLANGRVRVAEGGGEGAGEEGETASQIIVSFSVEDDCGDEGDDLQKQGPGDEDPDKGDSFDEAGVGREEVGEGERNGCDDERSDQFLYCYHQPKYEYQQNSPFSILSHNSSPNSSFLQAFPVSLVYHAQYVQTTVELRLPIRINTIQIDGVQEAGIILMTQTKIWTKRDQFRTQYAVLAKHVLCQRSKLKLYQIERSMHNTKKLAAAEGNFLMTTSFAQNIKRDIVERAVDLGNKFMQTAYFQGVLYGAPIIGITINAALAIHEYNHPESKPTQNYVIAENLILEEENKIESSLQAYLKSYQNQENFSQFVEGSCIMDDNLSNDVIGSFKSKSFIHPLMEKKNYICKVISGEQFKSFEIHKKIRMAQLYYQLVKALIEIVGLSNNKNIVKFFRDLREEHSKIKAIMTVNIRRTLRRWGPTICIQGVTSVEISDPSYLCNQEAFAESIFDEIFRCPATRYTIDCIYEKDCWSDQYKQEMKVGVQESAIFKHIGEPLQKYDTRKYQYTSRIRRVQSDKAGDWPCFYENVKNKAGSYDENWSHHKAYIDFDTAKVIYLNSQKLCILNSQYLSVPIYEGYELPEYSESFNSCFQLNQDEDLLYLQFAGMMDLRFMFVKKPEQQPDYKQTCSGSIETKNRKFRLAYKPKSILSFNFVNAYDFQARDIEDPRQRLVFQAITPTSYFPNSGQIQSFTCRITNQYDKSHFMIRKSKECEYGQFETNQFGEQLISVTLQEKLSSKNEYIGTMKASGCPIYLTEHIQLMWEKQNRHSEGEERFYIYFNQK